MLLSKPKIFEKKNFLFKIFEKKQKNGEFGLNFRPKASSFFVKLKNYHYLNSLTMGVRGLLPLHKVVKLSFVKGYPYPSPLKKLCNFFRCTCSSSSCSSSIHDLHFTWVILEKLGGNI